MIKEKGTASKQQVQVRLAHLQEEEKVDFKEHLDNLNDGVIAIILTIMVLEVPIPSKVVSVGSFCESIFVFLVSFFVVANFWYELNRIQLMLKHAGKRLIINNFIFLAALAVIPVLTKWMMHEPSRLAVISFGVAYFIANFMKLVISANAWQQLFEEIEGNPKMFSIRLGQRLLAMLIINAVLIGLAYLFPRWVLLGYLVMTIYDFFFPERTAVDQRVR